MKPPIRSAARFSRRALLAAPLAARPRGGLFRGTFFQPWARHLEWAQEQWEELLDALAALGCEEVILQWCRYDDIDYAPAAARLLDGARARRMRLLIGLPYESTWWKNIDADAAQALEHVVARARDFAATNAARIWPRHAGFGGWYLPEEIDDDHWFAPARRRLLSAALDKIAGLFRPLAASGFTNRGHTALELAGFWKDLAARKRLSRVLFQDGIGAGKMTLAAWPAYLEALRAKLGRRLDVVVEIFESRHAEGGFQAVPAGVERVRAQAELARRSTRRPPLCFSLPDYAVPQAGPAAAELFRALVSSKDER
jgi:sugar phosphate isomerase/epimerase